MGRIGIFGGSFNPPHRGHLLAAQEQRRVLQLDQVILIPAGAPPHKQLSDDAPTAQQRLAMTRALVADDPAFEVSDLEISREGPSYTADTLLALRAQYPEDELFLLMGTDMFLSFHSWLRPEEICRMASLCLALRQPPSKKEALLISAQAEALRVQYGARVLQIQNHYLAMSSTTVRRMLYFDCAEAYLTPAVARYIYDNGLYGTGVCRRNLSFEALRACSLPLHKEERRPHVVGCCETAQALAKRWGADPALAARAGILHDITKALDRPAHLALCQKYGIPLRPFEVANDKLLHAKSGAAVAKGVFGECAEVVDAIFWHTTGKADMSLLEKIIYLADYMEPNRDFDGVELLRRFAWTDLDRAMLHAFEMSVELLESRGRAVDVNSRDALDYMRLQLSE